MGYQKNLKHNSAKEKAKKEKKAAKEKAKKEKKLQRMRTKAFEKYQQLDPYAVDEMSFYGLSAEDIAKGKGLGAVDLGQKKSLLGEDSIYEGGQANPLEVQGNIAGYDLTGLFVGSEGTLGIATEITLRILKYPESVCVLLAGFPSIENTGQTVSDIISAGIIPGGMEIMDNFSINAVEDVVKTGLYPRNAAAILLVELDGSQLEVDVNKQRVKEICELNQAIEITIANEPEKRMKLWKGRKATFAAAGNISKNYYVQDGVIPRTKMAYVLGEIEAISKKYGYRIANVFHAGDGNLHPLILYDDSLEGDLEKVEEIGGEILKLCVEVGGSLSGEHGIGSDKKCYMPLMFNEIDLETMQWVRSVFNPKGLANPEKIFPTPRTCGESANVQKVKQFEGAEVF